LITYSSNFFEADNPPGKNTALFDESA